jgi:hypothetical protein
MITKELGPSYFNVDFFWDLELNLEPFISPHRRKEKSRVLFIFFDFVEFGASGGFPRTIAHYDVIHCGEAALVIITDAIISA